MRCRLLFGLALALGCGARTGVLDGTGGLEDDDDDDDDVTPGGDASAGLDAGVVEDAGEEPLACDGKPLPRPSEVVDLAVPARMRGLAVVIPDPVGVIIVGGQTSLADDADQMVFLDLSSGESQELPVEGDDVFLPGRSGVAVHVPERDEVFVVGGSGGDGLAIDQVFSFRGEGDPSGLRQVRARRLPDYPGGPVKDHVGVWDPGGQRLIVHGGSGVDGPSDDTRTTWAFAPDDDAWEEFQTAAESPPAGVRAMGYDPVRRQVVEISEDEDGVGFAVWFLSLEPFPFWHQVDEIDFSPSTRGELTYDPAACGFHLLSARRTRCTLEHWILTVDDARTGTTLRGELDLDPTHFLATSLFVPARASIVVAASEDCEQDGVPSLVAAEISLVR